MQGFVFSIFYFHRKPISNSLIIFLKNELKMSQSEIITDTGSIILYCDDPVEDAEDIFLDEGLSKIKLTCNDYSISKKVDLSLKNE